MGLVRLSGMELLSSAGSTGSGNISNYEDIYNFGLFKYGSAKVLCCGLGCNAVPLVNAPLDWVMERELRLLWRLFLQGSVSATLLAFCLLYSSLTGLNNKGIKSAVKGIRGIIWWPLGHVFRIQSSKVLNPPAAAHSP